MFTEMESVILPPCDLHIVNFTLLKYIDITFWD